VNEAAPVQVTPSDALTAAMTAVRGAIATLSPDDQTRVTYAFDALEPVVKDELDQVAAAYLAKLPVFGGIADGIVKEAIGNALDDGLAQLTAAKSQLSA
jgi:hypothetical protein